MPKVVPVDPKVADSYVGTFMLNPLAFVQVTKEQEKLYIQVTGEPRFRILATSPTEFFLRSIGTTVSFVAADGANAPAKLVLHHAGRDSVAVKMKGAAQTQPAK
jgi:hypothetical protein